MPSRFANLSEFFQRPEELATLKELVEIGPWSLTQLRWWVSQGDETGFERCIIRPNARRLLIHSGRLKAWLEERTAEVREELSKTCVA